MVAYIENKTISQGSAGYRIPIYFTPDSMSESISATYDQQTIAGRSAPVITYTATGARQVSISYIVSPDYLPSGFASVKSYLTAVKALEYPRYDNSLVVTPNCSLHLPGLDLDGVCNSVSIDYKVDRYTRNSSMAATVSLTFLEVQDYLQGSVNVINGTYLERQAVPSSYYQFVRWDNPDLAVTGTLSSDACGNVKIGKANTKNILNMIGDYVYGGNTQSVDVQVTLGDKVIYSGVSARDAATAMAESGNNQKGGIHNYNVKYIPKTKDGTIIDSSVVSKTVTFTPNSTPSSTSKTGNKASGNNARMEYDVTTGKITNPAVKKANEKNNTKNSEKLRNDVMAGLLGTI